MPVASLEAACAVWKRVASDGQGNEFVLFTVASSDFTCFRQPRIRLSEQVVMQMAGVCHYAMCHGCYETAVQALHALHERCLRDHYPMASLVQSIHTRSHLTACSSSKALCDWQPVLRTTISRCLQGSLRISQRQRQPSPPKVLSSASQPLLTPCIVAVDSKTKMIQVTTTIRHSSANMTQNIVKARTESQPSPLDSSVDAPSGDIEVHLVGSSPTKSTASDAPSPPRLTLVDKQHVPMSPQSQINLAQSAIESSV